MRALTVLIALGASGPALAQAGRARCEVDVTNIDFGHYSSFDSFETHANGGVVVDCTGSHDSPSRVTVSAGRSGNQLHRRMSGGRHEISYNLYVDTARHIVAGNGAQGTSPLVPRVSLFGRTLYFMFGAIPPEQAVEAGRYTDTLRVDVEF